MRTIKHKQGFTLLTLVVALGIAVYLNWEYARTAGDISVSPAAETSAVPVDPLGIETSADSSEVPVVDKNYGEAQLVSVSKNGGAEFFDSARLTRSKSRDEALDTLKKSLRGSGLTGEEKEALTAKLSSQIENITTENEVESLIKAKGFADCVVYIAEDKVNVTVMTAHDALQAEEVAQIRDIILAHCNVSARDICIVEVK